jgi:hypothetical protein
MMEMSKIFKNIENKFLNFKNIIKKNCEILGVKSDEIIKRNREFEKRKRSCFKRKKYVKHLTKKYHIS